MTVNPNVGHKVIYDRDNAIRLSGVAKYLDQFIVQRRLEGSCKIYVYMITTRRGKRLLFYSTIKPLECASKYYVDVEVFMKINKETNKPVLDSKEGIPKCMDATCLSKNAGAVDLALFYTRAKTNSRKGDQKLSGIYKFDACIT
jgi:hypothetical protein